MPKTFKIRPKFKNFAKSGHTGAGSCLHLNTQICVL